jgi:hypothetical protein
MPNPQALGSSSLAISQSVIAFTAFLPNFIEVGRSDKDQIANEVRLGETAAVVIALSIGALLSWLNGDKTPFFIAALMAFVLVMMYEVAMRKEV